ncbi:MAG: inorganic pyrophosphatase [Sphingobacteriales bacterium]|jgi:inorganic pyrophosphatase
MRLLIISLTVFSFLASCQPIETTHAPSLEAENDYEIRSDRHLVNDIPSKNEDGLINVVIEIPAGTLAKWEVNKATGGLMWEFRGGAPRVVNYLPYPGNYGMIPQTLLPSAQGGDGDPLDVIVLGEAVARGSIVACRIIGMIKLLDGGEQDDKLIAVSEGSPLAHLESLEELRTEYPGVIEILSSWFTNYKGLGKMEVMGIVDEKEALKVLEYSIKSFKPIDR